MLAGRLAGVPPRLTGYYDIVRFFGKGKCNPQHVSIRYDSDYYHFNDPLIARFSEQMAAQMKKAGRLYQGPSAMHVVNVEFSECEPSILVAPCNYGLQAGSCFALDYQHEIWRGQGGTLRRYYLGRQTVSTTGQSTLATCLGVSAWLTVRDGHERALVILRRADHLASLAGTVGPTVAGSVDYSTKWQNLYEVLIDSLQQETKEELALTPEEYNIIPLAYGLEIFRGERPQLLALIETELDTATVAQRLQSIPEDKREFESFEFVPLNDFALSAHLEDRLNHEGMFNMLLCQEYDRWRAQTPPADNVSEPLSEL